MEEGRPCKTWRSKWKEWTNFIFKWWRIRCAESSDMMRHGKSGITFRTRMNERNLLATWCCGSWDLMLLPCTRFQVLPALTSPKWWGGYHIIPNSHETSYEICFQVLSRQGKKCQSSLNSIKNSFFKKKFYFLHSTVYQEHLLHDYKRTFCSTRHEGWVGEGYKAQFNVHVIRL